LYESEVYKTENSVENEFEATSIVLMHASTLLSVQVLKAFVHGDVDLFRRHPELEEAMVWVYFHSNLPRFNRAECWGPLCDAAAPAGDFAEGQQDDWLPAGEWPQRCPQRCECCFPQHSLIPWPNEHDMAAADASAAGQTQQ
jgi:magnesium dechelatase